VRGRIDRVDYDHDRNGVAVVDYKTGRRFPKPDDVDHDVQLAVYYLAALRSEALARVGPPTRLELLYFRAKDPFFEQAITADHETVAEARIVAAAAEMLAEHLDPDVEADCDHCDFHRLCPLQKAGREVGAAR
jgi:RecB family exonuclease